MERTPLERCIQAAKDAGCPKDQVQNFLERGYVPYPWQWKLHAAAREADLPGGPTKIGIGGARGPGKSHGVFGQITLDDLQRYPGLKALYLRQTGKSAKESLDDLVARLLASKIDFTWSASVLRFPNGSRAILGGFKDERDIDKYVGIEYDIMGIEEGNQLSAEKKHQLRGSLRTSKPGWRPRWYETFNPGGLGHGDVKATYVEPYRTATERDTRFIPATYRDNPGINQEYIDYLEGLSGQLGKAWRDGDFDILAGQFFTEWSEKIHVCEPFDIPLEWHRWCELDYGHNAPSWLSWNAMAPDGRAYVYRELYKSGLTYSMLAEEFVSMTPPDEIIDYLVADPSIWNRDGRNDTGLSGAEIFQSRVMDLNKGREARRSIRLLKGNNDRLAGWAAFREWLRPYSMRDPVSNKDIVTAKLQVFETCPALIRTMPLQIHDENNPEDLDTDQEDHPPDGKRYGIMSRPRPSSTPDQIADRHFQRKMDANRKNMGKRVIFRQRAA